MAPTRSSTDKPAARRAKKKKKEPMSAEGIAGRLTAAIVERRLPPGTRLGEESLGEVFGVSRTKIREALLHLARVKLVTWPPGRSAFVAQPSVSEARQVFETRRVLEAATIARLAKIATPEHIRRLRAQLKREQHAAATGELKPGTPIGTKLFGEFHSLIADLAGNEILAELVREISARTSLIETFYGTSMSLSCSLDEHGELLACIERHDPKAAAQQMSQHVEHIERTVNLRENEVVVADLRTALSEYAF